MTIEKKRIPIRMRIAAITTKTHQGNPTAAIAAGHSKKLPSSSSQLENERINFV